MPKSSAASLKSAVVKLQAERRAHQKAIAEIDAVFAELGIKTSTRAKPGPKPGKRKVGRPKGSKNVAKKKPGRPKGSKNAAKKKPGRPKGSKNVAKKKPGRPKGSKNVAKKKPGRPKGSKNVAKKKAGRPKGSKNVAKKKAGRPKKTTAKKTAKKTTKQTPAAKKSTSTGSEFITSVIKQAGASGAKTDEIAKAWSKAGRQNKVSAYLSYMQKSGKIKREKAKGGKGSVYKLA